jgi:GNAT superfamily N-acetyltransferase
MVSIVRTTSTNPHFQHLVSLLDHDLAIRNGDENAFFAQFNKITHIHHVVVAYIGEEPIGCGAIKEFSPQAMEVKRIYILPAYRGRGIASQMLATLEGWTKELGYITCVLETGLMLPEAIALYTKLQYRRIPNYGQYAGVANSVCFQKDLV